MLNSEFQTRNKKDLSISLAAANLYSIPLIILPFIIFGLPYYFIWGERAFRIGRTGPEKIILIIAVFIAGAVIHELIHGIFWIKWGEKTWNKLKFGFNIKTLTPYIHCSEPINAGAYKIGTAAPGIILGAIPSLISIVIGNVWIFWFGMLFSISAGGDFIILWILRKVNSSALVEDHPSRAGCFVYENSS